MLKIQQICQNILENTINKRELMNEKTSYLKGYDVFYVINNYVKT